MVKKNVKIYHLYIKIQGNFYWVLKLSCTLESPGDFLKSQYPG